MQQNMDISPQAAKLIRLIRSMTSGELLIIVKDNRPIRVEQIERGIPLST